MSTLLYGQQRADIPGDGDDARSTISVVRPDEPTATAERSPEFNAIPETDPDTGGGLTTRQVSDYVVGSERYVPNIGNANADFAGPINSQVSTSGRAPSEEAAGRWGHGTLRRSEALEPTIREGAAFDNVYFSAKRPPIQDGALDYMQRSRNPDDATAEQVAAAAKEAARRAASADLYRRFLESRS